MYGNSPAHAFGRTASGERPKDCLKPNRLHQAAGMRIDPPPSVASASGSIPSATAAAAPPEEPPGLRARSNGLRVAPNSGLSHVPRKPMTGLLVIPTMIAPAASMRADQVDVKSDRLSRSAGMPP